MVGTRRLSFKQRDALESKYKLHSLIRDHGGTTKPLTNLREESIHFASFSDGQLRNWFNNRRNHIEISLVEVIVVHKRLERRL